MNTEIKKESQNGQVLNITPLNIQESVTKAVKEVENEKVKRTSNTTTVKLPSNGLLNPNVSEVTLRRMTTKEIKTLHTSKDPNFLTVLILGCIVDPVNVTENDLHPNDIIYLIFILRYISSPRNLEQKTICNHCRREFNSIVNIASLEVKYADIENIKLEVTLEEAECTLQFKILSEGDIIKSEKIAERQIKQLNEEDDTWYKIISKLAYMIETKDNLPFDTFQDKKNFLESLSAYDFETFRKAYDDISSSFGIEREFIQECPHCKRDVEVMAYFAPDFFRLV